MPHISLVIPAYNEAALLPPLLESVAAARQCYARGPDAVEVIVADNASTDRTAHIARAMGCRVVTIERRAIAAVRNGGARVAGGTILAFVDADSLLHPQTFNAIESAMTDRASYGATGFRFSRTSTGIAASLLVVRTLGRLLGGDSGVIFCRRADWAAVGGYPEDRRYAEDVAFLLKLRALGRSRGQRFARARGAVTVSSARKFDRYGDWHWFGTLARGLWWAVFDRGRFGRFVQAYWYDRRN